MKYVFVVTGPGSAPSRNAAARTTVPLKTFPAGGAAFASLWRYPKWRTDRLVQRFDPEYK